MPSKYPLLEIDLRTLPPAKREVTLRIEEIETVIHSKLPESANELSLWEHETEGNQINKEAWTNAGRKISQVHLKEKRAKLVRAR